MSEKDGLWEPLLTLSVNTERILDPCNNIESSGPYSAGALSSLWAPIAA